MINIKIPKKKNKKFIENFFISIGCKALIIESKKKTYKAKKAKDPCGPNLSDLYYLYQYILLNKRLTVLEIGSGWSSLIVSIALRDLKNKYLKKAESLKKENKFELFSLDNEKKYLNISKNRIQKFNKKSKKKGNIKCNFLHSEAEMTLFKSVICTQFKKLPLCNPDLIYLDGPSQFNIKKQVNGINIKHSDLMPLAIDILKIEYFLIPGTMIICDGRAANVKLLRDNLRRNWKYFKDRKVDQHVFLLDDPILGKNNKLQLKFYKS